MDPQKFDPEQNKYRITAFTNGNADINGLYLQLDHIQDPTLCPLDDLFTDHFMQGLFKHMKGAAEVGWTYEDYDHTFGDVSFNLSNLKIWGTEEGKKHFELALADRLFDHRVLQQQGRVGHDAALNRTVVLYPMLVRPTEPPTELDHVQGQITAMFTEKLSSGTSSFVRSPAQFLPGSRSHGQHSRGDSQLRENAGSPAPSRRLFPHPRFLYITTARLTLFPAL